MPTYLPDNDASMVLKDSVVLYKERLVYVSSVVERLMTIHDVETGEKVVVKADFDHIKAPNDGRLGYVNTYRGAAYVNRVAARSNKMGFATNNLKSAAAHQSDLTRNYQLSGPRIEALRQTYKNEFLSFEQVVASLVENGMSKAYDRSWMVSRRNDELQVYYRNTRVGYAEGEDEGGIRWLNNSLKKLNSVRNRPALNWR